MFFIVRGCLKVLKDTGSGTGPLLLRPPQHVGDMCLFTKNATRTRTIVSVMHSELLVVLKATVMSLLQDFPRLRKYYEDFKKVNATGKAAETGVTYCELCGEPGHGRSHSPALQVVAKLVSQSP